MSFNGEHRNSYSGLLTRDPCHIMGAKRLFERQARECGISQDRIDEMVAESFPDMSDEEAQDRQQDGSVSRLAGGIAVAGAQANTG